MLIPLLDQSSMLYQDGTKVKVGDIVKLWDGVEGTVVCSIDTGEYSSEFQEKDWRDLATGILASSPQIGLVHYDVLDEDFELLARRPSSN